MKLKLFTDLSLLTLGHPIHLLIPFTGVMDYENSPGHVMAGRFDEYYKKGKEFIELTTIEDCDACLLPVYYKLSGDIASFENSIKPFIEKVENSGKKTFVFLGHDIEDINVKINNAIVFSSAIYKSKQASNVYSYPHFFEDYIERYKEGKLVLRKKGGLPVIGFCGYAPPVGIRFGKDKIVSSLKLIANYFGIMRWFPDKSSHSYRAKSIIAIRKSKKIVANFRIKSNFAFGPTGMLNTGFSNETNEAFRTNFINNIIESDYTLCVRGIGNNSIRFFEALCCGRIPLFINTDSVLPFDFSIDWKKLCIWVEEKDLNKIEELIINFHENISEEEFIQLQKKLRLLWEEYFTPEGFFKNLRLFID